MATIVTRAGKGSPLTTAEVDGNFTNLNTELGTKLNTSSLATVATTGAYSDLTGKPTNVSSFTNDSAYITSSALSAYQPLDGDLTAIAALAGTTGFVTKTAANTYALDTSSYLTGITSGQVTTALGFTPYNATNPSGYTANTGTVTSVSGTGTVSGLTLTGSVTGSGSLTLGGAITGFLPLTGGTLTGALTVPANATTTGGGINFAGVGSTFIRGTSGDGASSTLSNLQLQSWFGIGFGPSITGQTVPVGENAVWIDTRLGDLSARRIITGLSDVRAPIFYDSNNTARYLDPASTSVVNTIEAYGGSGFRSFAAGSASIVSHLYFADAGNTRAWNWQLDENNRAALWGYNGSGWSKTLGVSFNGAGVFLRNSSGTDVLAFSASTFGYSSAYRTLILGDQASTTVCIGVDPVGNPSGSFTGTGSGVEVMFKNGVNFITPNSANNSYLTPLTLADGYAASTGSFRAPIFYDSNDTGYYIDPASTSNIVGLNVNGSAVYRSDWTTRFQSPSDFVDGTLVTTDIPATGFAGDSFVIEITGKTYDQNNPPVKVVAQGYLYNDTIINYSGISYAGNFASYVKVFQDGGVLKFWWPRISYWNSFNVNVMSMDGASNNTITRNRVTAIGNSTEPTGTKKVQINLTKTLKTGDAAGSISGFNNPTTAPTANTIAYRDAAGDIAAREIVLSSGLSAVTPTVLVSMYPATNQVVRTTPAAVAASIQGAATGSWAISVTGNAATATKANDLDQARYTNNDFNTLGASPQVFRAYTNYIPSGGSYNQPLSGGQDFKVLQWGDVQGGTSGNWGGQIVQNFYTDQMWFRRSYANTWQAWREFIHDGNVGSFAMRTNASATNSVDVRAPIFYDSNDTGYFINPNGDSNLSKTFTYLGGRDVNANWNTGFQNTPPQAYNFHGDISSGGPAGTWWFYESMRHSNASNYWGTQIAWGWEDNSNRLMQRNVSGNSFSAWVEYLSTGGRTYSGGLEMTGIIQSTADLRAPIYYDRDNTAYFVNPNGTSYVSGEFQIVGSGINSLRITSPSTTQSLWVRAGYNSDGSATPAVSATNVMFQSSGSSAGTFSFVSGNTVAVSIGGDTATVANYLTGTNSLRAPVFYDSNDTGYYVDPNSSGIALRTSGYWIADTTGWAGDIDGKIQRHNNSWYFSASNAWIFRAQSGAEPFTVTQAGVANATGDFRAPLYYDNADTNYYLDLNGGGSQLRGRVNVVGPHGGASIRLALPAAENGATSGIAALQMWCSEPGNSWTGAGFGYNVSNDINEAGNVPSYYFGRINTGLGQAYMRMEEVGHWHFYNTPQGSNTRYLTMSLYSTGYALAHQSFRAPIFYDSDNTGYYGDFAGTSNLVGLTVANTITGSVSGNAGNVTGTVAVANGGTGATTLTANNVLLGNGTSAVQAVAPSTTGNVLTSNGTTWVSSAPTSSTSVMELISTSSPSSASQIVFTGLTSAYTYYEIVFEMSGGNISRCQLSTDNGATFQNTYYYSNSTNFGISTVTQVGTSGIGQTYIDLGGPSYSGVIRFLYPTSTNDGGSNIQSQTQGLTTSSYRASGRRLTGGHNAIRLFPVTGTFTGTFKLYGVKV